MTIYENLFLSRQATINGTVANGTDIAALAQNLKDGRVAVLSQRLIVIGGQAKSFYITTN